MDKHDAELGWQSLGKVALKSKISHWKKSLSLKELLIHIFGWLSHHLHHCIMPVEAWLPHRWIQDISEHTVPLSQFKKPIGNCCIQDLHNTQSYSLSEDRKACSNYRHSRQFLEFDSCLHCPPLCACVCLQSTKCLTPKHRKDASHLGALTRL